MKKVLFVINTLGQAGAEVAMIELLSRFDPNEYQVDLYVLMNQGDMISRIPDNVNILNDDDYSEYSVLSAEGKKQLSSYVKKTMFKHGSIIKNIPYLVKNTLAMLFKRRLLVDKLLWKVMSDGAKRFDTEYDMAIAYLEGGSTYYVDRHVKAKTKVGFVHIDYDMAGYTRALDKKCYDSFKRVYTVSDEMKDKFLSKYPEYADKTFVFHNLINQDKIRQKAALEGGFDDDYDGTRILTVGRLTPQKAYEVAINALKIVKDKGYKARWYVLGEGEERPFLESEIKKNGLEEDFLLLGAKDNPYPYYAKTDIYAHCTRFEGKSIAIQEAQTLGCTLLVSDCSGNREQVKDGVDGLMCDLNKESIADKLIVLMEDKQAASEYGKKASTIVLDGAKAVDKLLKLMNE